MAACELGAAQSDTRAHTFAIATDFAFLKRQNEHLENCKIEHIHKYEKECEEETTMERIIILNKV